MNPGVVELGEATLDFGTSGSCGEQQQARNKGGGFIMYFILATSLDSKVDPTVHRKPTST